jgi:phytoene dehydrogenase-like protein
MHGTSYPRGSGSGIVKGFTKNIKKLGGTIHTSMGAHKILLDEKASKKTAVGVELTNGEKYYAKRIISNADPHVTYQKLLGEEHVSKKLTKKLSKTQYSAAALNLFLVVDMDLRAAGMDSGNIWYSAEPDLNKVYDIFAQKDVLQGDVFPAMFITSPTLKDPVSYDGKYHTLELIVFCLHHSFERFENTSYENRTPEYDDYKRLVELKMVRTLEKVLPGVSSRIKLMELGTPNTAQHYINATNGNCYGPDKILSQVGPFNYKINTEIENLHLTGAATFAHGLIGAVDSGINTTAKILGCERADVMVYGEGQELKLYEAEDDTNWPEHLKRKSEVKKRRGADKEMDTLVL